MSEVQVPDERRGLSASWDRIQTFALLAWLGFAVAVLVFGAPLPFFNRRGGPGSGFFLKSLAWLLIVLVAFRATTLMKAAWAEHRKGAEIAGAAATSGVEPIRPGGLLRCFALIAALLAYAALMPIAGFLVATTALGWITLTLLGRPPIRSVAEAVVAALVIRLGFSQGLGLPLPEAQFAFLRSLGL